MLAGAGAAAWIALQLAEAVSAWTASIEARAAEARTLAHASLEIAVESIQDREARGRWSWLPEEEQRAMLDHVLVRCDRDEPCVVSWP